ncbi:hypothetical protein GCM10023196_084550 [Actinoallomurus vinaceus]|uniref:Uncharacterized protein n=1 Tax=Actinoallomurus vinaceus TaxID=1080074 RepID=A0ABP8UP86_9ACTN
MVFELLVILVPVILVGGLIVGIASSARRNRRPSGPGPQQPSFPPRPNAPYGPPPQAGPYAPGEYLPQQPGGPYGPGGPYPAGSPPEGPGPGAPPR